MAIRVLIADPNRSLLQTYGEFLSRNGFEVATVADGLSCLAKLREWEPEILVLELDMPWGGGAGVLDLMRDGFGLPQIPVVVLTSRWDEATADDALAYRLADSFDFKPLAPEQLARIIRRQIDDPPAPVEYWRGRMGRRNSPRDASVMLCGEREEGVAQ